MKQILVALLLCGAAVAQTSSSRACVRLTNVATHEAKTVGWQQFAESQSSEGLARLQADAELCIDATRTRAERMIAAKALAASSREAGIRAERESQDSKRAAERTDILQKWADDHNRLAREYNALLDSNRELASRPLPSASAQPIVTSPQRQPLNCMAINVGNGISTLSCY